jgi:hypothetical protein
MCEFPPESSQNSIIATRFDRQGCGFCVDWAVFSSSHFPKAPPLSLAITPSPFTDGPPSHIYANMLCEIQAGFTSHALDPHTIDGEFQLSEFEDRDISDVKIELIGNVT